MGNTQVMFIRESGLMFRTFAEFLFKMNFSGGAGGGCTKCFWKFRRGGGLFFLKKMEILERWGVLSEIPSVVGVWIFSGKYELNVT